MGQILILMKVLFALPIVFLSMNIYSQGFTKESSLNLNERISTVDFVEILNEHIEETLYYYQNNWKVLRQQAQAKNYILSFQLLQTPVTEDNAIQLILMTTYADKEQYDRREENFEELIDAQGELKLLNDKKPHEFRKIVFGKEPVKHLY